MRRLRFPLLLVSTVACGNLACDVILGIEDRPFGDLDGERAALSNDASVDSQVDPATLTPTPECVGSPRERPEVLRDDCGIFVSVSGADTNPGTRALPVRTFAFAQRTASMRGVFRVFACEGLYTERLEIVSVGINVVGALKCDGEAWSIGGQSTIVRSPDEGVALRIDGTKVPIVLESLRFEVPNATTPGASSVVAQLTSVAGVTFTKSELVAGAGQKGADGEAGVLATGGGEPGNVAGSGGIPSNAAAQKSCACTLGTTDFGTTAGGAGGVGATPPTAGLPALNAGGAGGNGVPCSAGARGANGDSGDIAPIPKEAGKLIDGVWTPTAGGDGTSGSIAQGGGGGGASGEYAGGGGGCGGCPTTGGKGGKGGGGSIGIVASDSTIALVESGIQTAPGAAGGKGGEGPSGQIGGAGQGNALGTGCSGGQGGTGGSGGHGGGGAGGVSIGIVHRGATPPTIDPASDGKIVVGPAGAAGVGRIPGPTKIANGPAGLSQKVLSL